MGVPRRAGRLLVLDHRAAGQRDIASDTRWTALGQVEGCVLLVIGAVARGAIDGNDNLVATLRCTRGGSDSRALEGVAAHDHGLDACLPQRCLKRRAKELIWTALSIPLAGARANLGVHDVVGRCFAVRADK